MAVEWRRRGTKSGNRAGLAWQHRRGGVGAQVEVVVETGEGAVLTLAGGVIDVGVGMECKWCVGGMEEEWQCTQTQSKQYLNNLKVVFQLHLNRI